jgi:hypothetical protein
MSQLMPILLGITTHGRNGMHDLHIAAIVMLAAPIAVVADMDRIGAPSWIGQSD